MHLVSHVKLAQTCSSSITMVLCQADTSLDVDLRAALTLAAGKVIHIKDIVAKHVLAGPWHQAGLQWAPTAACAHGHPCHC